MTNSDDQDPLLAPSKSQLKRDMLELQALGTKLIGLDKGLIDKCKLPAPLLAAISEYKRLPNKNEARRRQLQFIGKLMRSVDTSEIDKVLNQLNQHVGLEKQKFQQLELLREKLLAGDEDTLKQVIDENPGLDIQHLSQLIRQAQKELTQNKPPASSRKLFKYLREINHQ